MVKLEQRRKFFTLIYIKLFKQKNLIMDTRFWFLLFCSLFIHQQLSFAAKTISGNQSLTDGNILVSSSQTFELGFFTPGSSRNRYLGIWYKRSPETVVWVANRDEPITNRYGVLMISNGNLVLVNQTKDVIWSSNVSRKSENGPVAELLDSGNLVVRDGGNYVWQSFDHPSDTFLPGMKLGWNLKTGQETYLTSWRSVDDPSPGIYTCRIDFHGLPQLVIYAGEAKEVQTGPWNGFTFGNFAELQVSVFKPIVVQNEDEVYYTVEPLNNSLLVRAKLDQSGYWQRLVMYDWNAGWNTIYSWPRLVCDNYGQCGANTICRTDTTPFCQCLEGFRTISHVQAATKCVWELGVECQRGEGFVKLERIQLPDLLDFRMNENMNLDQCAKECLRNCSCRAYGTWNVSAAGTGCLMWFGDLIDIKQYSDFLPAQAIHIRVSASVLASLHDSSKKKKTILLAAMPAAVGTCMLGLVIYICWKRLKRKGRKIENSDMEVPFFDMESIATATNNFSEANAIGEGGFGLVYKGELSTGQQIAVKRLSKNSGQGAEEFMNEVAIIAKLQHRNLVGLIGSCIQGEERMLIYEYMPNKSLDYHIFDHKNASFEWKRRFDIVLGVARGLLYLHQDSKLQIIHRDLKASNVLLDKDMNPKISDFGLARIFSNNEKEMKTKRVIGTYGYMSPEYAIDGTFSVKSDVFSFGVLLLEIVSGKRNRGFSHSDHHHSLLGHAWLLWNEGRSLELMDTDLKETSVKSQVLRCIQVGLLCVQKLPEDRPVMLSVVSMLTNEGPVFTQPKQPGFFTERRNIVDEISENKEQSTSTSVTMTALHAR